MDPDLTAQVAAAVRERLATSEHTERSLSESTGIPRTTLKRRLAGRSPFTIAELGHVARELGVAAADFFPVEVGAA